MRSSIRVLRGTEPKTAAYIYLSEEKRSEGGINIKGPASWRNQLVVIALSGMQEPKPDRLLVMLMSDDPTNNPIDSNSSFGVARISRATESLVLSPPLKPVPWDELRQDSVLAEAFKESIADQLCPWTAPQWGNFLIAAGHQLPIGIWNELGMRIPRVSPQTAITAIEPKAPSPRIILA